MSFDSNRDPSGDLGGPVAEPGEGFFRQLLDSINDLVWSLSLDGQRMLYLNESAQLVYGDALKNPAR